MKKHLLRIAAFLLALAVILPLGEAVVNKPASQSYSAEAAAKTATKKTETKSVSKATKTTTKKTEKSDPYKIKLKPGKYKKTDYHENIDIEDNVFMDSLIYTGYNIKKHRKDGLMWVYILCSQKRGLGWLSDISYSGASSGYEKTKSGKPDIKRIARQGGLVCASYVTYVYFNYLPRVAKIDTSSLTKPTRSYSADSWYKAAKDWVKKGYSKNIKFSAYMAGGEIKIKPKEEIPIGSIIAFTDFRNRTSTCSHVCVYAGYKKGYHWVYQVGNDNGPEFCAIERMSYGPDPQWPLGIITTPSQVRMAAGVELTAQSDAGKALKKVTVKAKNTKTGKTYKLGKTNKKGKLSYEGLPFGKYTVTCSGSKTKMKVTLNTKNNGLSKITLTKTGKTFKLKKK